MEDAQLTTVRRTAQPRLTGGLLGLMAVAAGIAIANNYYNQPLLAVMQDEFHASAARMGGVPMLTQVGYAAGMFFFVPLADATERRRLISSMLAVAAVALAGAALAPTLGWLMLASFAIGFGSIVPQLLVPFTAHLAPLEWRGKAVGTVMSGLLMGILLGRTVAGYLGSLWGWRAVFWLASGVTVVLAATLRLALPRSEPETGIRYAELMASLPRLARESWDLREAAITGGLLFGSFSALWATLAFRLETPPYHYGSAVAGAFGLVGVAGAAVAPLSGRISDRRSPRLTLRWSIAVTLISYLCFWLAGLRFWGLVRGTILLDAGVNGGHIANQTRIYRVSEAAHGRVNTVYMVGFFAGGALGSWLGPYCWEKWGWPGVCAVGLGMLVAALGLSFRGQRGEGRNLAQSGAEAHLPG